MASFDASGFDFHEPPPRPTTPPVRRGFVILLVWLCLVTALVYGIPYVAERTGYAWESGRARAASAALEKLDRAGVVNRASELFRLASTAVSPAVVNIRTQRVLAPNEMALGGPRFHRNQTPLVAGIGSGVVIDKTHGYIVTNNHVVKDADQIIVHLGTGRDVPARLVGSDPKTDLAVIQIHGPLMAEAQWGDSDALSVGDWVLAIGSPFALDRTVTAGIVSATGRTNLMLVGDDAYEDFIQTDAAINPGNSGGPLIDLTGKVVGINTAIYSESGGNQGVGLAIPSAMVRKVVEQIIRKGKVVRGYLGVAIQNLTPALAKEFNVPEAQGAIVAEVRKGSPAEQAGLQVGDVIVALDGKPVGDVAALRNRTAGLSLGTRVPVTFYRGGTKQTVPVTIAELPAPTLVTSLGLEVEELPRPGEGRAGTGRILVIKRVEPGSAADRAGLVPGLRIVAVGVRPVRTKAEYEEALARLDLSLGVPLKVQQLSDGRTGFVTIGGLNAERPGR